MSEVSEPATIDAVSEVPAEAVTAEDVVEAVVPEATEAVVEEVTPETEEKE